MGQLMGSMVLGLIIYCAARDFLKRRM